jgi:hypothetical protein
VVMACLDNIEVIDLVSGKQSGLLVVKRSLMLGKVPSVSRGCSDGSWCDCDVSDNP